MKYLHERRKALGGYLPQRRRKADAVPAVPPLSAFERCSKAPAKAARSRPPWPSCALLTALVRDKEMGKRIVPIVPDEARTFGMEGMFRQLGIFASEGQKYEPVDKDQVMFYREDKQGQILEEGINEAGAFSSWIAAATSYSHSNEVTVPFYIFYSMFGMQRIGDLAWAAADQRARGFLLGATAGRTTLNGEGLQHEDGHSHVLSSVIPNCVSYDPTYGYEVAVIIQDGLRRMVDQPGGCVLLHHPDERELRAPADARKASSRASSRGMYLLRESKSKSKSRVQLLGPAPSCAKWRRRRELLESDWGVAADVWSATSFTELRRDGLAAERWNLLHPEAKPRMSYRRQSAWRSGRRARSSPRAITSRRFAEQIRPFVPQDRTYTRARHRRLRALGLARQAAPLLRGQSPLRHRRGAEGARRPGRAEGEDGGRRDQEIRHRSRKGGSHVGMNSDMSQVVVPDIGDFKEVEVIEVLVKPGDAVTKEQSLVTLESDKATMEIPSPSDGVVQEMKIKMGDKVSKGSPILELEAKDETAKPQPRWSPNRNPNRKPKPERKARLGGSATTVPVPDIGDFKEVEVIEVLVKPGDTVAKEQSLVTLESDKATMEIPSPSAGVVKELKIKVGDKVSKGSPILVLRSAASRRCRSRLAPRGRRRPRPHLRRRLPGGGKRACGDPRPRRARCRGSRSEETARKPHASPSVRKFARELGVDLHAGPGERPEGPHPARRRAGVRQRRACKGTALRSCQRRRCALPFNLPAWPEVDFAKFGPVETKPLSRIQKLSGPYLHRNWISIPHVTQFDEADITDLEAFRKAQTAETEKKGFKLTMLAFMIKACVTALRQFPQFNSSLDKSGESIIIKKYFHIGVAVDTPGGLVVPVVRDADRKGVFDLAHELADI